MVTLKVIGNLHTTEAKLDMHQLALLRQAQYYEKKVRETLHDITCSSKFNANNPGSKKWTPAMQAVTAFVCRDEDELKIEIVYD